MGSCWYRLVLFPPKMFEWLLLLSSTCKYMLWFNQNLTVKQLCIDTWMSTLGYFIEHVHLVDLSSYLVIVNSVLKIRIVHSDLDFISPDLIQVCPWHMGRHCCTTLSADKMASNNDWHCRQTMSSRVSRSWESWRDSWCSTLLYCVAHGCLRTLFGRMKTTENDSRQHSEYHEAFRMLSTLLNNYWKSRRPHHHPV